MKAYIKNLSYYLPNRIEENELGHLRKKTGIDSKHICEESMTAADMAQLAAENLFNSGVDKKSVDYLLFCTQSPDYFLPTTACILQDKLGLNRDIGALDFNLGCSGYIYGLGLAKGLIESDQAQNVLLLTSETYSKYINPKDNTVKPLFGDAATATLISAVDSENSGITGLFYGTDGRGFNQLIIPVGGARLPNNSTPLETFEDSYGNVRTNRNLYMDGAAIMNFALDAVPETIHKILEKTNLTLDDINYFVFHQANKFILRRLQQKCNLEGKPYWNDVKNYGNTVSSSIPLAMCDMIAQEKNLNLRRVMLLGFGVGLSWGGCIADLTFLQKNIY